MAAKPARFHPSTFIPMEWLARDDLHKRLDDEQRALLAAFLALPPGKATDGVKNRCRTSKAIIGTYLAPPLT